MKNNYYTLHYTHPFFSSSLKKRFSGLLFLCVLYAHGVAAGSVTSYITVSGNVQSGCSLSAENNHEDLSSSGVNVSCDLGIATNYQFPQITISKDEDPNVEQSSDAASTQTLLDIGGILSF